MEGGHGGQGVGSGGDAGEFEGGESSVGGGGGAVGVEQLLLAFLLQPVQHLRAVPLHLVLVDAPLQHSTAQQPINFTLLSLKRICIVQLMITSKTYGMVTTKCK